MKITNQLLDPLFQRIAAEYQDLNQSLTGVYTDEALELKAFIEKKLRQLETVRVSLSYLQQGIAGLGEPDLDLRDMLRQHKLELRFARRRWKRHLVSQERIRRNHERRTHVPTFAA
jgi:hypothetical protein